ncbi:hypothetical protein FIBSPDRAFT_903018 [Athelia psychrophila]|uniref:Uncharacterized protein n=1 Tax=Athelia psychrophila TaxID=1759441 RepID=A0A167WHQ4_9AGAM|nr:hypothetical protein FIBSPDRAFT_903018 [Fibularhizoctonia sp. CBS 109695]
MRWVLSGPLFPCSFLLPSSTACAICLFSAHSTNTIGTGHRNSSDSPTGILIHPPTQLALWQIKHAHTDTPPAAACIAFNLDGTESREWGGGEENRRWQQRIASCIGKYYRGGTKMAALYGHWTVLERCQGGTGNAGQCWAVLGQLLQATVQHWTEGYLARNIGAPGHTVKHCHRLCSTTIFC